MTTTTAVKTSLKKGILQPFKLQRTLSRLDLESLDSSNVGDFSWSWILKGFIHVQIEKGKAGNEALIFFLCFLKHRKN